MKNPCCFLLPFLLALFVTACSQAPDSQELVRAESVKAQAKACRPFSPGLTSCKKPADAENVQGKPYGYLEQSKDALDRKNMQQAQECLWQCLALSDSVQPFMQAISTVEKQAISSYEQTRQEKAKFNRDDWFRLAGICLIGGLLAAFFATRIFARLRCKEKVAPATVPSPAANGNASQKATEADLAEIRFRLKELAAKRKNVGPTRWKEIEKKVNRCFPQFDQSILAMHVVSQLELRVCHLLKLGLRPSEIARLLNKSDEAVSAIRRRLCQKCFPGEQPSATRWDQFIDSL